MLFSIVTPAYNRAHTLHRAKQSLIKQSCQDFEWIIVDDGSTDNTLEVVSAWTEQVSFPLVILNKSNGGKASAMQYGLNHARGEFVVFLDSDDALTHDALQLLYNEWLNIPEAERKDFVGVTGLCEDEYGEMVGSPFPESPLDSNAIEVQYRYRLKGEKMGFLRRDVLTDHPFEIIGNKAHMPESLYWGRIAQTHRTRYVNEVVRIYYRDDFNQNLSKIRNFEVLSEGSHRGYAFVLSVEIAYFWSCVSCFILAAIHYVRYSWHAGHGIKSQVAAITGTRGRILWVMAFPVGTLVYWYDRLR